MTAPSNETLLQRWFRRVWQERNPDAIDEIMAPDALVHGLGPEPIRGPAAFREFHKALTQTFASVSVVIHRELIEGDSITALCTATVRRRADSPPLTFHGSVWLRTRGDQVVESRDTWDFLSLLEQMDVLPSNALALAVAGQLHVTSVAAV
jgi:hypothetical protein